MDRPLAHTLSFDDLEVLVWVENGPPHAPAGLALPWCFASTVFQLTPLARSLRRDEAFNTSAFAASLLAKRPPNASTVWDLSHHGGLRTRDAAVAACKPAQPLQELPVAALEWQARSLR